MAGAGPWGAAVTQGSSRQLAAGTGRCPGLSSPKRLQAQPGAHTWSSVLCACATTSCWVARSSSACSCACCACRLLLPLPRAATCAHRPRAATLSPRGTLRRCGPPPPALRPSAERLPSSCSPPAPPARRGSAPAAGEPPAAAPPAPARLPAARPARCAPPPAPPSPRWPRPAGRGTALGPLSGCPPSPARRKAGRQAGAAVEQAWQHAACRGWVEGGRGRAAACWRGAGGQAGQAGRRRTCSAWRSESTAASCACALRVLACIMSMVADSASLRSLLCSCGRVGGWAGGRVGGPAGRWLRAGGWRGSAGPASCACRACGWGRRRRGSTSSQRRDPRRGVGASPPQAPHLAGPAQLHLQPQLLLLQLCRQELLLSLDQLAVGALALRLLRFEQAARGRGGGAVSAVEAGGCRGLVQQGGCCAGGALQRALGLCGGAAAGGPGEAAGRGAPAGRRGWRGRRGLRGQRTC
jgi:hypothetical protein